MKLPRFAREQHDRAGEIVGVPEPSERGVPEDRGDAIRREHRAVLLGGEEPRHEHVAADAERPPFAGEVLREVVDRGFGHRVREDA